MEPMHVLGSLKKYLIYLSYVGHEFRGMQKQLPHYANGNLIYVDTVQGMLENALKLVFKPINDIKVMTSSRTDAGVHALRTAVHVELHQWGRNSHPSYLTIGLNQYFVKNKIGIRIQSTHLVPDWFSSRAHATSRTYLYRIAFRKDPRPDDEVPSKHIEPIPFSEYGRTFFAQTSNMDMDRVREAASLIPGTKDYFSFMGRPSRQPSRHMTVRSLYGITVTPGRPFMPGYDPLADLYLYWDIIFHGRSFLYRQVRRTVGVLLAVGRGDMDLDDVRRLLDHPVPESWNQRAVMVPPWGLYLLDVTHDPLHYLAQEDLGLKSPGPDSRTTMALSY